MMITKKVITISDYIICLVLSLAMVAAPFYIITGRCEFTVAYLFTVIIVFIGLVLIDYLIRISISKSVQKRQSNFIIWNTIINSKYSVLWLTLIILVFWFPIIFALYPGTLINDTWGQLSEYIRYYNIGGTYYGRLSDHHPFVDTLIMGSIITPFGEKLQNWQLGFFVYTILQVILTACSFSCAIIYLYKKLNVKSLY